MRTFEQKAAEAIEAASKVKAPANKAAVSILSQHLSSTNRQRHQAPPNAGGPAAGSEGVRQRKPAQQAAGAGGKQPTTFTGKIPGGKQIPRTPLHLRSVSEEASSATAAAVKTLSNELLTEKQVGGAVHTGLPLSTSRSGSGAGNGPGPGSGPSDAQELDTASAPGRTSSAVATAAAALERHSSLRPGSLIPRTPSHQPDAQLPCTERPTGTGAQGRQQGTPPLNAAPASKSLDDSIHALRRGIEKLHSPMPPGPVLNSPAPAAGSGSGSGAAPPPSPPASSGAAGHTAAVFLTREEYCQHMDESLRVGEEAVRERDTARQQAAELRGVVQALQGELRAERQARKKRRAEEAENSAGRAVAEDGQLASPLKQQQEEEELVGVAVLHVARA